MGLSMDQHIALEKEVENMAEKKMKKTILDMGAEDFPSNANKVKRGGAIVAQARVQLPKKSAGRKISETFLADDAHNVFSYIMREVLIPAAKTTISDLVNTAIDRMLFGGDASTVRRRHRTGRGGHVSYGSMFPTQRDPREFAEPARRSVARRVRQSFEDIVLETRDEAQEVMENLLELIDTYEAASLADFYGMVGIPTTFIDVKYGWETLANSSIVRVTDGWVLNLPRPIQLN